MKLKSGWNVGKILILAVFLLCTILMATGCVSGLSPVGWSGGTVFDGKLFVGSTEGRLAGIDLTSENKTFSEQLKAASQTGLFGCSASSGGGCGGGSTAVAIYGSPVVSGDLVYIAGYNGKIYAFSVDTMSSRWVYPRDGYLKSFVGGLAVSSGKLFVGNSDGKVYCFDAVTGDKLWEYKTGDRIWATPAVDGDTVYIGSFDKKLHALNINDGSEKWTFTAGGSIISTPLIDNGTVYFGAFDRKLYAVNVADGHEKWTFTGNNWFWAGSIIDNGIIYTGCLDGYFYMIDSRNGNKISEFKKGAVSSTPIIVDNYVVFATKKPGTLYKLDMSSREVSLLVELGSEANGSLAASGGYVYAHVQGLSLIKVNVATGSKEIISLKSSG